MKTIQTAVLATILCAAVHADFSYTQTRKTTGGMVGSMAGANGPQTSLLEMTIDSSDFSTASIPDSVFAVPAGYQKN